MTVQVALAIVGAGCFGLVIGWMTCRVHHDASAVDVKWLATVIATVGGGAVTALFEEGSALFGSYCIGLAVGFFVRPAFLWLGHRIGVPTVEGKKFVTPGGSPNAARDISSEDS